MPERSSPRIQLRTQTATLPSVRALGQAWRPHEDLYHWTLDLRWSSFFAFVAVAFLVVNAIFAVLYRAQTGAVAHVESLEEAFYFSVQTIATIGYGGMMPVTRWGHVLVTVESLIGIMGTALVTGITFAKFARPRARVLFSDKCCVAPRDGVPHLMFRMANWRHNVVVEAQLRVILLVEEVTLEGEHMRKATELPLVRDRTAMFSLSWTALHRIDEASPFFGADALARLEAVKGELFLGLAGVDETTGAAIHARHHYDLGDIVWNARFKDILTIEPDGRRVIDYRHFHEVVAEPASTMRGP